MVSIDDLYRKSYMCFWLAVWLSGNALASINVVALRQTWGEGGAVTSVGWQITLCDPIDKWRPVVLR